MKNPLPMRGGVSASTVYLPKTANNPPTIFEFLCQKFPHISMDIWQQRFADGIIFDGTHTPLSIDTPYRHGQNIHYYRAVPDEVVVPFCHEILFENDEFMVVDKPHFLTVAPAGRHCQQTLLARLKEQTGNFELSPIHRLDKDTAGLILISKNPATRHRYQSLFATQNIAKTYHAIAKSPAQLDTPLTFPLSLALHLERGEPFYTMRVNPHQSPNSHTDIAVLADNGNWAKYELSPSTGKLHQLRVHMHHLGLPIKNDPFYPAVCHRDEADFSMPLQLLAKQLSFIDPITAQLLTFVSRQDLYL